MNLHADIPCVVIKLERFVSNIRSHSNKSLIQIDFLAMDLFAGIEQILRKTVLVYFKPYGPDITSTFISVFAFIEKQGIISPFQMKLVGSVRGKQIYTLKFKCYV